jgi:uncharacterized protein (TIGR02147 family)
MDLRREDTIRAWKVANPLKGFRRCEDYLRSLFTCLKAGAADFSYGDFGALFGFSRSSTYFHLILTGRRPLSGKALAAVVATLGLDAEEATLLRTMAAYQRETSTPRKEQLLQDLEALAPSAGRTRQLKRQHRFHAEWYHVAIRELIGTKGFREDPRWIARRLRPRISAGQARQALKTLLDLGLVARDEESGNLRIRDQAVTTGDDVKNLYLKMFHRQMLALAAESLDNFKGKDREVAALTIGVDPATADEIRMRMRAFRQELVALIAKSGQGTSVYQVNFQMFPLVEDEARD